MMKKTILGGILLCLQALPAFAANPAQVVEIPTMAALQSKTAAVMAQYDYVILGETTTGAGSGAAYKWQPSWVGTPDGETVIAPYDHPGTCSFGCTVLNLPSFFTPNNFIGPISISDESIFTDFVLSAPNGYGFITTAHSGNTFHTGNSHVGVADSAIAFNSNEISVGRPEGVERGAIGVHAFGDGTFETFFECSNDPVGVSMNPPTQCGILQTGYISPYGYAQRKRLWLQTDGTILIYDASDDGTDIGTITTIFPATAANGVIFPKGLRAGSTTGIGNELFTVQGTAVAGQYAAVIATASGSTNTNGLLFVLGGTRTSDDSFSAIKSQDEMDNALFQVTGKGTVISGGGYHFYGDNSVDLGETDHQARNIYVGTAVVAQGSVGVTCSGAPSGSFATIGGVVTHC